MDVHIVFKIGTDGKIFERHMAFKNATLGGISGIGRLESSLVHFPKSIIGGNCRNTQTGYTGEKLDEAVPHGTEKCRIDIPYNCFSKKMNVESSCYMLVCINR